MQGSINILHPLYAENNFLFFLINIILIVPGVYPRVSYVLDIIYATLYSSYSKFSHIYYYCDRREGASLSEYISSSIDIIYWRYYYDEIC